MKVAIFHDYFNKKGGGERFVLSLAKYLDADIYTGYVDKKNTFEEISTMNVTEIGKSISISGLRNVYLMHKFSKLKLKGYDLYIFSGTSCISAVKNHKPNILYCHTPPRFIYDLKEWFMRNSSLFNRLALKILIWYMKPKDQKYMRQFDTILTNSQNVRNRLKQYYDKKLYDRAQVLYCLVDARFKYKKTEDFYVSYGRLDKLKRVDIIIKAFQKMPKKKLVVMSGGPELKNLRNLAKGYDNITVKGYVSDKKLMDTIGSCVATIYIPINEDMGLAPIESALAGKPCIAANEGGLKELVIEGKTGNLIKPTEQDIIKAVQKLTPEKSKKMRKSCEKWGKNFREDQFIKKFKQIIKNMNIKSNNN